MLQITVTRLEIGTYMGRMRRIVMGQRTKDEVTRIVFITGKTLVVIMRNAPIRGDSL
jgi:hypothetical protein